MKKLLSICTLTIATSLSFATDSGWVIKLGASQIIPKDDAGVIAGADAEVSSEINFTPAIEYQFDSRFAVELLLALPYEHTVSLAGLGDVATFQHLPPTITAKYDLLQYQGFALYAGGGLNYTLTFEESTQGAIAGANLESEDSFGPAATIGVKYQHPSSPFGAALDLRYISIDSDLTLNGADIGTLDVDPYVVGFSLTYQL